MNARLIMKALRKGARVVMRHLPEICIAAGIGTAVMTVKETVTAVKEVDKDLTKFEERQENGEEIKTVEYITTIGGDCAKAVMWGSFTILFLGGGYYVLFKRVAGLSSVVSAALAENKKLRERIDEKYGEGSAVKLTTIPEGAGYEEKDIDGRKVISCKEPAIGTKFSGFWYPLSSMYVSDDPFYNKQMIEDLGKQLDKKIKKKGVLYIKDVLDLFDVPNVDKHRHDSDGMLGWTEETWRGIEAKDHPYGEDPLTGKLRCEYQVVWATPSRIY